MLQRLCLSSGTKRWMTYVLHFLSGSQRIEWVLWASWESKGDIHPQFSSFTASWSNFNIPIIIPVHIERPSWLILKSESILSNVCPSNITADTINFNLNEQINFSLSISSQPLQFPAIFRNEKPERVIIISCSSPLAGLASTIICCVIWIKWEWSIHCVVQCYWVSPMVLKDDSKIISMASMISQKCDGWERHCTFLI